MASIFSLSGAQSEIFPAYVTDSKGINYQIECDYRNILTILRMQNDYRVIKWRKPVLACRLFYREDGGGSLFMPGDLDEAVSLLADFIVGGGYEQSPEPVGSPKFDFEFDAESIYTSFLSCYKVNLLKIGFLHWYDFRAMLASLPKDCPFSYRVWLRGVDLGQLKGKEKELFRKAKKEIQLPKKYTDKDIEYYFYEVLAKQAAQKG